MFVINRAAGYATFRFDGFAIPCLLTKDFQSFSIQSIKCFYHHQRQYFFQAAKVVKPKQLRLCLLIYYL